MKRHLKILGHKYRLKSDPEMNRVRNTSGTCCANIRTIVIDSSFYKSRRRESLIHEIIEALKYHLQLVLTHDDLSSLSEGLYQVLHDNKLKF
jgi:hypothetical protein